jgi:hypothetical protein
MAASAEARAMGFDHDRLSYLIDQKGGRRGACAKIAGSGSFYAGADSCIIALRQ